MAILAVTGLRAEGLIARQAGFAVLCAGGNPAYTDSMLGQAIGAGKPSGLLSFGIAGGLMPGLVPGRPLVATAVIASDGARYSVDEIWRARLHDHLGVAVEGDVFGADAIVATATEKAALHARTGALAVDLESAVVARAAERAGLPFMVIRAIADPADRTLPPAARIALTPDGRPDLRAIFHSVLMEPGQIGALIRLARETRRALQALTHALAIAGPLLIAER
jgi:adenosylhomocysteine nucleosidase